MKYCIVSAALLWLSAAAFAADADSDSLLQAHLSQAKTISSSAGKSGTGIEISRLKEEINARLTAWTSRVERRDLGDEELLSFIPADIRAQAHDIRDDDAKAEKVLKNGVTLELLMAVAAERSPEVRMAYENLRAVLKHFEQASYLEDLVIRYRSFVRELDTKVGPQTHKEMPSETFAFPSNLALKGQVVDDEAEIARLDYLQALKTAMNGAAGEFFEVQAMGVELEILEQSQELLTRTEKAIRSELETGKGSQADLLKVQSNLATLRDQVDILRHHRWHHAVQINIMLALPPQTEWGQFYETDLRDEEGTESEVLDRAHKYNQELLKAEREAVMQTNMVRMAESMTYPRASKGMSQIAPSMGAEAGPTRSEMTTFPQRFEVNQEPAKFGADAAYIDELRVKTRVAKEEASAMRNKIRLMVDHAFFTLHVASQNLKTYTAVTVPKAKQSYDVMKKRLESADTPYTDVLESGRAWLDAMKMQNDSRRERNKALIDLQDAAGTTAGRLIRITDRSKTPVRTNLKPHEHEGYHP